MGRGNIVYPWIRPIQRDVKHIVLGKGLTRSGENNEPEIRVVFGHRDGWRTMETSTTCIVCGALGPTRRV